MDGNLGEMIFTPAQMESESPHWDTSFSKREMGHSVTEPERRFGGCRIHTRSQLLGDMMHHPVSAQGLLQPILSTCRSRVLLPRAPWRQVPSAARTSLPRIEGGREKDSEFLWVGSLFRTSPPAPLKTPRQEWSGWGKRGTLVSTPELCCPLATGGDLNSKLS